MPIARFRASLLPGLAAVLVSACMGEVSGFVTPGDNVSPPVKSGGEVAVAEPTPLRLRLLLGREYRRAVSDLLGAAAAAKVSPPLDMALNGSFAIGASQLSLSTEAVSAYEASAHAAAKEALATPTTRSRLVFCTPSGAQDPSCMGQVVKGFGQRAWRRPLLDEELAEWTALGVEAAGRYQSFDAGVRFAVAGMLTAPDFLYLVEVGEPDPEHPGWLRRTSYEMASRLSFLLLGTTPTDELLAAAAGGALSTPEGVRQAAEQLLSDPRARASVRDFAEELFRLGELPTVSKDRATYPSFSAALAGSMREETLLLLEKVLWEEDADVRTAFSARHTFVDAALAQHYGLTLPAGSTGFTRVVWPEAQRRAGVLSQGAFLSLAAHPVTTSPTHRGKFVKESLLCEGIPAPPPSVNTNLPPVDPSQGPRTLRERLSEHMSNPGCSGCHARMDPIGFAFEPFDATGRHRTTDNGKPIDATGTLDGEVPFDGAAELGAALAADPRLPRCLALKVFRHATGHLEQPGDAPSLERVDGAFAAGGFRFKRLLVEVVTSDSYRYALKEDSL